MRRLWLHIGHDKTGSSFLQSSFAIQAGVLERHGIAYPGDPGLLRRAREFGVTSGNAQMAGIKDLLAMAPGDMDVLMSYEGFFNQLAQNPEDTIKDWLWIADTHGFDRIEVLLFIRNPMEHAQSVYMQGVRYRGYSDSFDAYLSEYSRPRFVMKAIQRLRLNPRIGLTIKNYSACKNTIFETTMDWLGLQGAEFETFDKAKNINRGLTDGELTIIRFLNKFRPKLAHMTAQSLQEVFPEGRVAHPVARLEAQEAMFKANEHAMAVVNRCVAEEGHYRVEYDQSEARRLRLSEGSVAVLHSVYALLKLRVMVPFLKRCMSVLR